MLPIGLQFQLFKTPKKLPMRLESGSMEDFKKNIYKIANIEYTNEKKKSKRNKTKKAR
jgi:hypothetical protein